MAIEVVDMFFLGVHSIPRAPLCRYLFLFSDFSVGFSSHSLFTLRTAVLIILYSKECYQSL